MTCPVSFGTVSGNFFFLFLQASFVFLNKLQKHISFKDKFIANSWKILLNSIYGNVDITSNDEEVKLIM